MGSPAAKKPCQAQRQPHLGEEVGRGEGLLKDNAVGTERRASSEDRGCIAGGVDDADVRSQAGQHGGEVATRLAFGPDFLV